MLDTHVTRDIQDMSDENYKELQGQNDLKLGIHHFQ